MPGLSNAERQRRYRERARDRLNYEPNELTRLQAENSRLRAAITNTRRVKSVSSLSPDEEIQRAEVIADLTSSRAWWRRAGTDPPTFMGMTREGWMHASPELIAFFGMSEAIETARIMMQEDLHKNLERRGRRSKHLVRRF